jgi:AbiTii
VRSIVEELQSDAINSSSSILELLRKSLLVSKKLKIISFEGWISLELKGYGEDSLIPKYRHVKTQLRAWNPFHGWQPVVVENKEATQFIQNLCDQRISQPISELIGLVESNSKALLIQLPFQAESLLSGMFQAEISLSFSKVSVERIIEAVRDIILDWALKLESDGIMGEGISFSTHEKEIAAKINYENPIKITINQVQSSSSNSQSNQESFTNELKDNVIGSFDNQVKDNVSQTANQHIYSSESRKTLSEAAVEIQQLLTQLERNNPVATDEDKVTYLNEETSLSFKRRVVSALQSSGETAIDEFILENRYLKVLVVLQM